MDVKFLITQNNIWRFTNHTQIACSSSENQRKNSVYVFQKFWQSLFLLACLFNGKAARNNKMNAKFNS